MTPDDQHVAAVTFFAAVWTALLVGLVYLVLRYG
jgi:hypothetical protein